MNYIICHYGEIALKGGNRKIFEKRLVKNIGIATGRDNFDYIKRIPGRIVIKRRISNHKAKNGEREITEKLSRVFGIANFSFAISCGQNIEEIKKKALEILSRKRFKTFRISARRSQKNFRLTSREINEAVGDYIRKKMKKRVDLDNPGATCFVELADGYCFLYTEKIAGSGGLPVGVSGKAVALLSGGIDSPVASWYGMKRGLRIIFAHFHAYPYTDKASIEKVKKLVGILRSYQGEAKLYLIPFGEIQKEILLKTPAALRVVLYRRFMARISEKIAVKEGAQAIITGENLGQVASQTIQNMAAVESAVKLPILRPLVGFDKQEIIRKAQEIGTFDVSVLPDQDCCSRFLPDYPETKAKAEELKRAEKNLNPAKLIRGALKSAQEVV